MEYFKNPVTLKNNIKWISNLKTKELEKKLIKEKFFNNPKVKQKKVFDFGIKYLKIKDKDKVFFCKLVEKKNFNQELKSFIINKNINNLKLAPFAYNYKKILLNKKESYLFIYQFISEKKFLIDKRNLKKIFHRLKILHKVFKKNIKDVKFIKKGISREKKIYKNFNIIIKDNLAEKNNLLKCYYFFLKSRQLVHGDLHLKNIIYKDNFFFIDFEETSRTFLNPNIDYLNIILKMILSKKLKKLNIIKFYYQKKKFNNLSLYILLKFIIYRNLSILKFYKFSNEKKKEQKKFYKHLSFLDGIKSEINS